FLTNRRGSAFRALSGRHWDSTLKSRPKWTSTGAMDSITLWVNWSFRYCTVQDTLQVTLCCLPQKSEKFLLEMFCLRVRSVGRICQEVQRSSYWSRFIRNCCRLAMTLKCIQGMDPLRRLARSD